MVDQGMVAWIAQCEKCFFLVLSSSEVFVVCMDNCPLPCAPASALTVIIHPSFSPSSNCSFPLSALSLSRV